MAESRLLFVGLPEGGKTTFLAALWYFLRYNRDETGLAVVTLPGERDYLNSIADTWLAGVNQTHTKSGNVVEVSLDLKTGVGDLVGTVMVPDISGELFRDGWADRAWNKSFFEMACDADGVLLFFHPNHGGIPVGVADITATTNFLNEGKPSMAELGEQHQGDALEPFDPRNVPPQVILIDQIQCLLESPCYHKCLRLSVVVSAWDTVKYEKLTPAEWLEKHAPLLWNFLSSNDDTLQFRIFGVSAQGGSFDDDNVKQQLMLLPNPIDRIDVAFGSTNTRDICSTFRWMMSDSTDN